MIIRVSSHVTWYNYTVCLEKGANKIDPEDLVPAINKAFSINELKYIPDIVNCHGAMANAFFKTTNMKYDDFIVLYESSEQEMISKRNLLIVKKERIQKVRRKFESMKSNLFMQMIKSGKEYKCCINGCDDKNITIDHIKPIAAGGSNEVENLQFMCLSHNAQKGTNFNEEGK